MLRTRRARLSAASVSVVLAAATAPVFAGPQYGGRFGTDGTWNVYELITPGVTWDQARVNASQLSFNGVQGHLVSILSAEENAFVNAVAGGDWWIGLTDSHLTSTIDNVTLGGTEAGTNPNGGFVWVSGEPFSFQAFGGGEPNDAGGIEDAVHKRGDSLWNDHRAGTTLGQAPDHNIGYIVEYRVNAASNPILRTFNAPANAPKGGMGTMGIREVYNNGNVGDQETARNSILNVAPTAVVTDYTAPVLNILDSGSEGRFAGNSLFASDPDRTGATTDTVNNISLLVQGTVRVTEAGTYTFGVNSDDGFTLLFPNQHFAGNGTTTEAFTNGTALTFRGGRGSADTLGQINLPAGDHPFVMTYHEGGGGSQVELFAAKGAKAAFDHEFNLVGGQGYTVTRKAGTIQNGWNVVVLRDAANDINNLTNAINRVEGYWNTGTDKGSISTGTAQTINYRDPEGGGGGKGFAQQAFPGDVVGTAENNFALGATASLEIAPADAGTYTFVLLGDDGARFRILGTSGWTVSPTSGGPNVAPIADGMQVNGCCSDAFGTVNLNAGTYDLELIWNEIGGGAYVGLWGAPGVHTSFNSAFQLLGQNINEVLVTPDGLVLVPEPTTFGLVALGAASLLARRRRTR